MGTDQVIVECVKLLGGTDFFLGSLLHFEGTEVRRSEKLTVIMVPSIFFVETSSRWEDCISGLQNFLLLRNSN
jgi:hypothetical protein